jgi:hypothetical protein
VQSFPHDRKSLEYWVSWRMLAMSERKAAPPRSAREDLLAVGLANRPEPDNGGNGVGDERQHEGLKARFERQSVPCRDGGDRGRIGDRLLGREAPQRLAVPGGARRRDESCALRRRLQAPLGRRRERDGKRVGLEERGPVARFGRTVRGGEQDGVGARRAEGQKID